MDGRQLIERFRFERRTEVTDDYGNTLAGWQPQFTVPASSRFLKGSESVIAARLEARQPAIIAVRASPDTKQIGPEWRAVDDRTGEEFAIREKPRHPMRKTGGEDRGMLEMLAEVGVAT